jgi:hypothetical protein
MDHSTAGDVRDKYVAMFYWTWHQGDDQSCRIKNITEILKNNPSALYNYNDTAWRNNSPGYYYWEQPLFGYYKTTDEWVLRKHAEMLADAKVDVVFFDCTNGSFTWDDSLMKLLEVWEQARQDGVNTPKIAFMLPFGATDGSLTSLRHLYEMMYMGNYYNDLWFYLDGKPVIMAHPDNLTSSDEDKAIKSFFTFRPGQPDYVNGPSASTYPQWGWLEVAPQHGYNKLSNGTYEEVTVGVSQNANAAHGGHCCAFSAQDTYGRSHTMLSGFSKKDSAYLYGLNFLEQWDRAYKLDPKLVFVTGWNEFISGQWLPADGWDSSPIPFSFVDEYDWEHSRDIEPNKGWGEKGDVYYMQLVDRVRKFKGMKVQEDASAAKTIDITNFDSWSDVKPSYTSYKGNTMHRDAAGRCNTHYTNTSGRNDIVGAKVARDSKYMYFYVETAEDLTASTGKNWMMLFIDADRNKSTGWQGYDYVINHIQPDLANNKAYIQICKTTDWDWLSNGECEIAVSGNKLALKVDRSLIGLGATGSTDVLNFEFKWNDNMQDEGNPMDFYVNGDVAPGGRFNYLYTTSSTGVENILADRAQVSVYPNPATDVITVKGAEAFSIVDLRSGITLRTVKGNQADVSGLSQGVYAVKTVNGVARFIKR